MPPDALSGAPQPTRGGSCARTLAALIALAVAAILLLMLPTGFIGPVFVFGGGLLLVIFAFHWLVWGRLVDKALRDHDPGNSTEEPAEPP